MASTIVMGEEELSLYDALIKHYLALKKRNASRKQIDSLFIENEENNSSGEENNG